MRLSKPTGLLATDTLIDRIHVTWSAVDGATHYRVYRAESIDGEKSEVLQAIRGLEGIKYVRADMEREAGIYEYEIEAEPGVDIRREINRIVRENGWNILLLRTMEMTLEDIFLKITMGENLLTDNDKKEAKA